MSAPSQAFVRWSIAPDFLVDDVITTANFYRDKLGFRYDRFWGEPPCFCMLHRNGIIIMLSQSERPGIMRPNQKANSGDTWDAYIWVDAADALYKEFQAKGVKIAREICDQPYQCRDFDVEDCNGFRLCFGQPIG
jgi:predicted enzyme related to lactoylglutathione lyase